MIDFLKQELKLVTNWLQAAMVGLLQNLDLAMQAMRDNLPAMSAYLTPDILKYAGLFIMGVCVVIRVAKKPAP